MKNEVKNFKEDLYTYAGLENLTENTVLSELYNYVQDTKETTDGELCNCWICLADVAAIVLNGLKPYYCSNFIDKDKSNEYIGRLKSEVRESIIKAFETVKKNPHHNA